MGLNLQYFLVAEGATLDSRGLATVVALAPQAFLVKQFPSQVTVGLAIMVAEELDAPPVLVPGSTVHIRLAVTGPDDEVLLANSSSVEVAAKEIPEFPTRVQLVAQIEVPVSKSGHHQVAVDIRVSQSNEALRESRGFLVREEV